MLADHPLGKLPRVDWEWVEDFGLRFCPWDYFGDVKFFHCFYWVSGDRLFYLWRK
jgi:hypothetical protein